MSITLHPEISHLSPAIVGELGGNTLVNPMAWTTPTHNDSGALLPWKVAELAVSDETQISSTYGTAYPRQLFLDGYAQLSIDIDPKEILWTGFPGKSVYEAATFGNRKRTYAVTHDDLLKPGLISNNPANFALRPGLPNLPTVVALRKADFRRVFLDQETGYKLRRGKTFDGSILAMIIARGGGRKQKP